MKNCLLCGQPFSGKRKDALYCSGTCKAKYSELKKSKGLSGFQLQVAEPENTEDKTRDKTPDSNTVDAIDLEPFANILGATDEINFNTTGLNEGNNTVYSSESNTVNNSKEESEQKNAQENTTSAKNTNSDANEEEIVLPLKYVTKEIKENNPTYQSYSKDLAECQKDIKTCEAEIARLNYLITEETKKDGSGFVLAGAGLGFGAPLIHNYFKDKENNNKSLEPNSIQDKNGKSVSFVKYGERMMQSQKKSTKEKTRRAKEAEPTKEEKSGFSFWEILLMGTLGTGVGYISKAATEDSREAEKAKKIKEYQAYIVECQSILNTLKKGEEYLKRELAKLPAVFTKQVQQLNPFYQNAINLIAIKKQQREAETKSRQQNSASSSQTNTDNRNQNLSGLNNAGNTTELNEIQKTNTDMKASKNLETDKIFSMKKIAGLKHQLLDFNGKWLDFFGLPQTNFFCVVHGMSGEGKSHFAMQFGKYLAERFGNVLYISGEEGFASTFQQKIEALGASIERYYATEIKTGEEVLKDVPNQYHFIIIDSLNNMGIDTELMRAIRAKYKQSGIIAICQSTKDGKIRGSYEIVHDSDMAVKVVNGIATTTKNRFKEKHKDFDVFAVYNKKKDQAPKKKNEGNSNLDEDFDNTIR